VGNEAGYAAPRAHAGGVERLAADAGAASPAELARQLLLLYDGVKAIGLVDHSGVMARDARAAAVALLRL
jgi:hypothetical protein